MCCFTARNMTPVEYPDLLLGNMSIKNISDFDNQETIANCGKLE